MKIDIFPHILPVKYKEAFQRINKSEAISKMHDIIPTLYDLDYRFRVMDAYGCVRPFSSDIPRNRAFPTQDDVAG